MNHTKLFFGAKKTPFDGWRRLKKTGKETSRAFRGGAQVRSINDHLLRFMSTRDGGNSSLAMVPQPTALVSAAAGVVASVITTYDVSIAHFPSQSNRRVLLRYLLMLVIASGAHSGALHPLRIAKDRKPPRKHCFCSERSPCLLKEKALYEDSLC